MVTHKSHKLVILGSTPSCASNCSLTNEIENTSWSFALASIFAGSLLSLHKPGNGDKSDD